RLGWRVVIVIKSGRRGCQPWMGMRATKASTLCCQPSSSGPLTSATWTLPPATSTSPLRCRISFMIGRTRVHSASSSSLGMRPVWPGCGAASVAKMLYFVLAGSSSFFMNRRMLPMGLPKRAGELKHIQVGRWQLFRRRLPDVMDRDRDALGGHLPAELFRDHRPVAVLGGVQVLDL